MRYTALTDELLLVELRNDDEQAFREIYLRYWKKLYHLACRKIESVEVVEELVQDVFLNLWERRATARINHLEAYLTTAIRYTVINHIKTLIVHDKFLDHSLRYSSGSVNSTDEQVDLDDLMLRMEVALHELPEKTRQVFRLNRIEYKSVKEVATQLNMPQRTVEYHLHLAIRSLKVLLRDFLVIILTQKFYHYFDNK
ncbi:RNA polymerase sigma factor [Arsenicibacter rosenii]|uniref:RNA polymerase sigma-70 factor n=1 Tax=Arsenicibacter rosenii TaxID=1750698 RepID=A0A1S2VB32_9BACT|nr:sigma-70 family RNA polymerase sigma factor [Arsenicibacter rosenii]OIN55515.1 RNA polymerase sigma-70 factor [Arsenicibacter rosenii]